jgi:hypothetical protein
MSLFSSASWGEGSDYNLVPTPKTVRESNPSGSEIFRTRPDRLWGPLSLMYNGYHFLPRGKERLGRDAKPSPLLVPWSRKSTAMLLLSYEPYGLYRASGPVLQVCILPYFLPYPKGETGTADITVVKVLRYKSEGHWFDPS